MRSLDAPFPYTISDLIDGETRTWQMERLSHCLWPCDITRALKVPFGPSEVEDSSFWCYSKDGRFTVYRATTILSRTSRTRRCHLRAILSLFPATEMIAISCHIVGPFVKAKGTKLFLVVAVDYFTKWVEVEPLSKISQDVMIHFIWKTICCRFGLPRILVSDNGTQFK